MTKKERYRHFVNFFSEHQPDAATELHYTSPYQLIISVILSAQCTDKRVNETTPALYQRFPDFYSLSKATFEELQPYISNISYPNNKTRHLIRMANMVITDFNGQLPEEVDELQKLPGVGRKTANVLASVLHNKPAMAVDTHVFRVAARIGLTTNAKNPLQSEKQLVKNLSEDVIPLAHHWLILHGRYICVARRPKCEICPITYFCKYYEQVIRKQKKVNSKA